MTPSDLRAARAALGLTAGGLALALKLGKGGDRTVRRWESGERPIPGPVEVAVTLMCVDVVVLDRPPAPCDGDLSELGGDPHGMQGQEGRPEAMKMKPKKPKKGKGGY